MDASFDPLVGRLHQVLDLRLLQHTVTASNLANADTPGYRAKVVEFDKILDATMRGASPLRTTDTRHFALPGTADGLPPITELDPPPWSVDGNSVLAERESARLNANALQYDAVARGLDRKLSLLEYAVTGGRA